MTTTRRILQATAGNASALDISELFATDLYTGNNSTQTITNGIDLSGEGGLVWIKRRNDSYFNMLFDTERGATKRLMSDDTAAQSTTATSLTSFNSDGFSIGNYLFLNQNLGTHVSWTFRKSPNFFDVVTYTGDGTISRAIDHNLGIAPGMIVVKRTDSADDWYVWHRSQGGNGFLNLNDTGAYAGSDQFGTPTDTQFLTGTAVNPNWFNNASGTYVAYLFSHDPSDTGVIQCGSYTGNGSTTGPTITLGWEPQWVMTKAAVGTTSAWIIWDNQRSPSNPRDDILLPNSSSAELNGSTYNMDFTSTGFQPKSNDVNLNGSGNTYIYMAIRKEGV